MTVKFNFTISDCQFENMADDAVHLDDAAKVTISDCEATNSGRDGFHVRSPDITVTGSRADGSGRDGFNLAPPAVPSEKKTKWFKKYLFEIAVGLTILVVGILVHHYWPLF
jgi:Right handed beta helix region